MLEVYSEAFAGSKPYSIATQAFEMLRRSVGRIQVQHIAEYSNNQAMLADLAYEHALL